MSNPAPSEAPPHLIATARRAIEEENLCKVHMIASDNPIPWDRHADSRTTFEHLECVTGDPLISQ